MNRRVSPPWFHHDETYCIEMQFPPSIVLNVKTGLNLGFAISFHQVLECFYLQGTVRAFGKIEVIRFQDKRMQFGEIG